LLSLLRSVNKQQVLVDKRQWWGNRRYKDLPIFITLNMKITFDIRRLIFYLWVGLVFLLLWLYHDYHTYPKSQFPQWAINEIWRTFYIITINFLFFELILPRLVFRDARIILSLFAILILVFLFSFGLYSWRETGIALKIWTSFATYKSLTEGIFRQAYGVTSSLVFFGICTHIFNHVKLRQTAQQLRIQKQQAELNYLKSQTNPHFLFNTLNNIYSLARDKSDLAPESILRLSQILRFMLYETGGEYINIEQEMKIINDYISLEKLRYDDSLEVSFTHNIEDKKQQLPPLLLMPLVENAFKHGVSETRSKPFIDIRLSTNQQLLSFVVKNSSEKSIAVPIIENIGLTNLRRQLELLYTDYQLTVEQNDNVFIAKLNINLASHV
jgi:two-component system, LytTR family, sensor kinase